MTHTLDLKEMGLAPIDETEMQEVNGGFWQLIPAALVIALVVSAIDHWSDIKKGARDAWNNQ